MTRNIFKKIYDEVTEDMFDMSIVCWLLRIAEATLFCFQSVKFSKTFGFSIVHLV